VKELNCTDRIVIKVLGISGSPRREGNTEFLLREALDAARSVNYGTVETELYALAGKKFLPCIGCSGCSKEGRCVFEKDDDFGELRDKWVDSDAVIMAVPVYHMGIPGQLKCFIDRLGNSVDRAYPRPPKRLVVYGAIAQGVDLFSGVENATMQIINHALIMGGVVVAGDAPESYIGGGGWARTMKKDALEASYKNMTSDAKLAVDASRSLGRRVADLALILKAGALHFTDALSRDPVYLPLVERVRRR
jgi:multimeric flavodoxin WrbA